MPFAADIPRALQAISESEIQAKLAAVAMQRHAFDFKPVLTEPPNAVNHALARACRIRRSDAGILGEPRGHGLHNRRWKLLGLDLGDQG